MDNKKRGKTLMEILANVYDKFPDNTQSSKNLLTVKRQKFVPEKIHQSIRYDNCYDKDSVRIVKEYERLSKSQKQNISLAIDNDLSSKSLQRH